MKNNTTMEYRLSTSLFSIYLVFLVLVHLSFPHSVVQAREACNKLPRTEVQFICNRNITMENGLNATKLFEDYYQSIDWVMDYVTDEKNTGKIAPYKLQLYPSVSLNTVEDVSYREWYYQRCDFSNEQTLVTIDVRGYFHWDEPSDSNVSSPHHYAASMYPYFEKTMNQNLESFISKEVCGNQPFDFFRKKIREWEEFAYPTPYNTSCLPFPPVDEARVPGHSIHGGGYETYPTSSIISTDGQKEALITTSTAKKQYFENLYEHRVRDGGYSYDHNLYLLCGGIPYYTDSQTTPGFLVLATMCGYIMVLMIRAEFIRPLRHERQQRSSRSRDRNTNIDNSSINGSDNDDDENLELTQHRQEIELADINRPVMI